MDESVSRSAASAVDASAAAQGNDAGGPGKRQLESERRRQRILEAARERFGEVGFARATVESIAAGAGVSNGLLYQFFRNKEHLFEVVVGELFRDWRRAILAQPEVAPASHADRLATMFRNFVEFARSHPLLPALLSEDAVLELARFSDLGGRWSEAHREHVAGILRAGVEAGEFDPELDVPSTADIVCQLQTDYSTRAYRPGSGQPDVTPPLVEAVVRMVRQGLRANPPAARSRAPAARGRA